MFCNSSFLSFSVSKQTSLFLVLFWDVTGEHGGGGGGGGGLGAATMFNFVRSRTGWLSGSFLVLGSLCCSQCSFLLHFLCCYVPN